MVEAHQGGSRLTNLLHNHTLEEVWLALGFSAILSWQRLCFESPLLFSSEGAATSTPLAQSELFMNGANLLSSIVLLLSFIAASTGIIKAELIVVKKETFALFASGWP